MLHKGQEMQLKLGNYFPFEESEKIVRLDTVRAL